MHPQFGIAIVGCLLFLFVIGVLTHRLPKRFGRLVAFAYYFRTWVGRVMIPLGVVNGYLGFLLAKSSTGWVIAYLVLTGFAAFCWGFGHAWVWQWKRNINRRPRPQQNGIELQDIRPAQNAENAGPAPPAYQAPEEPAIAGPIQHRHTG